MHTESEDENGLPDVVRMVMVIDGGVWITPPPAIEPEIMLIRWSVFELPCGSKHFVGYNAQRHSGRVSTEIVAWNPELSQGVTRSGRRYRLVGAPGLDADGMFVWGHWSQGSEYVDVTSEYVQDGAS